MRLPLSILALLLTVVASAPASAQLPDELTGRWQARPDVSTRSRLPDGDYHFTHDTLPIRLDVTADGRVTGVVGGATLADCTLRRNRGRVGRMLRIKTDYVIRGRLVGPVFAGDTVRERRISAPFNLRDGALRGTLFHLVGLAGLDLYPMARLELERPEPRQR
jgi:hypothetical protein